MQLYDLIQSMTKSEKRHFKLHVQIIKYKKETPKYILLFDLINSQTEYDEEAIREEGFGSSVKSFLHEKLLESLHLFHLYKLIDNELNALLSQIYVLFEKKIWDEMGRKIKKTKQIAKDNERFLVLLETIELEQHWAFKTMTNNLEKEKQEVRKQYDNFCQYFDLSAQVTILRGRDRSFAHPNNLKQFKELTDIPLFNDSDAALSVRAATYCHYMNYLRCEVADQPEKARKHLGAIVEMGQTNHFLFYVRDYAPFYIRVLSTLMSLSDDNEEIIHLLETMKNIPAQSIDTKYTIAINQIKEFGRQAKELEGKLLIDEMEQNWDKYAKGIKNTRLSYFMRHAMLFYSIFEEWDNAQKWMKKIYAIGRSDDRRDVQIGTRLWQLVISYEQNPAELDKSIQSVYKYLVRNEHYFEVEAYIIKIFKDLCKVVDGKEERIICQKLYDFLNKKIKNTTGTPRNSLIHLLIWAESKITKTTMAEVRKSS